MGQIKYVFTDKTGTLTKNNMIFKNLICGGRLYGKVEQNQADLWKAGNIKQSDHAKR